MLFSEKNQVEIKNLIIFLFVRFVVLVYNGFGVLVLKIEVVQIVRLFKFLFRQDYFVIIAANSGSRRKCKNDKQAGIVFLPVLRLPSVSCPTLGRAPQGRFRQRYSKNTHFRFVRPCQSQNKKHFRPVRLRL